MTAQSFPISSVGCDPTRNLDVEDDLSTATPPVGYRNSDSDHEMVSKTIRFNFAPVDCSRIDSIDPAEVHTQWLRIITSSFGNDVKIINNFNKPVSNISNYTTTAKRMSHEQQFKLHQKSAGADSKIAFTIVHRILIRVPFGQLKRHSQAFQLLKDHNCFLREHMWDEQEWDVQQIGFVTGFNPKYYTPEKVTSAIRNRLTQSNGTTRAKVPKFQTVLKTHKILHNGRTSSTQAFSVEVPFHSAHQLVTLMKDATKDTKDYVSFQMRRRNPDAFQGAIRYQNHILANQHVVMINYLGLDAMYYLSDRIQAMSGVQDVIPAKKVDQNGKFYVLVQKNDANKVRQSLQKQFAEWFRDIVPEDAKPKEGQFEGPPVVPNPKTDGYSSGENSWMTTSTKSFMEYSVESMTTNTIDSGTMFRLDRAWDNRTGDTIHQSTNHSTNTRSQYSERTYASYAAATVSDQVSGMTESDTPRDIRHEELTNKIATLEAMIERLCQQVQVLTNTAAQPQAIDPDDSPNHREKRLDRKASPRKHKQSTQYSAPSGIEEDNHEPAPMDEDRLTAWDDYSPRKDDDL
ncbi:hypothetical protein MHU86_1543 [Fragilaria crotonensis]|nr:hypothetical protein MHU86_1543 [Fragilaria crotonensis]